MPPTSMRYQLTAIHDFELIQGVYNTIPELLEAHGERLGLTRKRVLSIRTRLVSTRDKYKHIMIEYVE